MSVSFKDLEASMKRLFCIPDQEKSFEVNGVPLTIGLLTPEEEVFAAEYSDIVQKAILSDSDSVTASIAATSLSIRIGHLAFILRQIGDINLRGLSTIEVDGESILRHEALSRLMIENWDSDFINHVFNTFASFSMEKSLDLIKQVKIETNGLDDAILFHEKELQRLKEKKEALQGDVKKKLVDLSFPLETVDIRPEAPVNEEKKEPETIRSSFVEEGEDMEKAVEEENQRLLSLMRDQRMKAAVSEPRLPEIPPPPQRSQQNIPELPKNPREQRISEEMLDAPRLPPRPNPRVQDLRNAQNVGGKILVREEPEVLDEGLIDNSQTIDMTSAPTRNPRFRGNS